MVLTSVVLMTLLLYAEFYIDTGSCNGSSGCSIKLAQKARAVGPPASVLNHRAGVASISKKMFSPQCLHTALFDIGPP